jgi:hypothetical protein
MAIEFIQEDGTGLSDSTSYASIIEMQQYWENNGWDYSSLTDDQIKILLNKATRNIDSNYSFNGYRETATQALEWPRMSSYYLDGYEIAEDSVPVEILKATNHLAYLINEGNDPEAIISKDGKIIAESSKVDVISKSVKYEEGSSLYQDILTPIDNILRRLTGGVNSNFILKVIRVGGESP